MADTRGVGATRLQTEDIVGSSGWSGRHVLCPAALVPRLAPVFEARLLRSELVNLGPQADDLGLG
jgi:hypothetical protein